MPELALQATWNEPVQAGQHFKNVLAPWCKSMWAADTMRKLWEMGLVPDSLKNQVAALIDKAR